MESWFLFQAEDSVDDDVLNSFCWMYSSFDMPETFQFPCARKKYDGTYLYNTYYQWVSIFLAFNAGLFYIPRCIWLIIEGGLMSYMVKGKQQKIFIFFPHLSGNNKVQVNWEFCKLKFKWTLHEWAFTCNVVAKY